MNDQPEALSFADRLTRMSRLFIPNGPLDWLCRDAATELRRQHAEIERLRWLLNGGGLCSKPLDADIAAILHANLDSLYVEDPPAIDAALEVKP